MYGKNGESEGVCVCVFVCVVEWGLGCSEFMKKFTRGVWKISLVCCHLTFLLLNMICPVLANSVDPDQLASEEANWSGSALFAIQYMNLYQHSVYEFISTIWIKESDWLTIRSGCGILIYSAGQGLILLSVW